MTFHDAKVNGIKNEVRIAECSLSIQDHYQAMEHMETTSQTSLSKESSIR